MLHELHKELDKPGTAAPPSAPFSGERRLPDRPIPVEVRQPDPGALQTLAALITPLVRPLTTTGIVVIFVIFILLQRQDLRNRLIRLAGAQDLQRTTAALDDAGQRLSRLFLMQLALNAGFGLVIGVGLWVIGVPNAPLWGMLAMILRFVPYIGAVIAAILPLVIAAAVGPSWTMVLWTAALFVIVEPTGRACRRAAAVRPQHRPFTRRGDRRRHVLDLAVGTDRPHSGDALDRLPRRARPPRRSPQISRRDAGRPAATDAGTVDLSTHAGARPDRGRRTG